MQQNENLWKIILFPRLAAGNGMVSPQNLHVDVQHKKKVLGCRYCTRSDGLSKNIRQNGTRLPLQGGGGRAQRGRRGPQAGIAEKTIDKNPVGMLSSEIGIFDTRKKKRCLNVPADASQLLSVLSGHDLRHGRRLPRPKGPGPACFQGIVRYL